LHDRRDRRRRGRVAGRRDRGGNRQTGRWRMLHGRRAFRFDRGRRNVLARVRGAALRGRSGLVGPCSPFGDRLQGAVQETLAARVPFDLAAGSLGDAAGLDQRDRFDRQFVFGRDVATRRIASKTLAMSRWWRRSTSWTTTRRSAPSTSIAKAAPLSGRSRG